MKNKILFFLKLPPPTTGATLMNKRVHDSNFLRDNFHIHSISISYMEKLDEMGKKSLKKLFIMLKVWGMLFKELSVFHPDLVYFQISPHGIAFLRDLIYVTIIKLFRVRIVFHMRGKGIKEKPEWQKTFYRFCFKTEHLICLSSLLTYDVEDVYFSKPYIVHNGIPDIIRENILIKNNKFIKLLFLSNLIISKGILDFLEALSILKTRDVQFKAIIVGAEKDLSKTQINQILQDRNIDSCCSFLGLKYGDVKGEIMNNSDILVFPTKNDIFGNVILEAMQFELPVIATDEGAIPEIIDDGVTGFIVDKNAPEQIAEKLEFLINNPEKRIEMGKAGRKKFLEKYTIEIFEENMKNVFEDILHRR